MKLLRNYREAVVGPSNRSQRMTAVQFVWSGTEVTATLTSLAPHEDMLSHGLELLVSKQNF